jgi:hypothetical protein
MRIVQGTTLGQINLRIEIFIYISKIENWMHNYVTDT